MCISKASSWICCLVGFPLRSSDCREMDSAILSAYGGEAHNKANNSVSVTITAFLHTVDSISLKWQYADLTVRRVFSSHTDTKGSP